jgi:hypothetical protein
MNDTAEPTQAASTRPSIALTTPFLSLAAAVIALAAFLLGYVVKDIGADHRRPEFGFSRIEGGPKALERGRHGFPGLPPKDMERVTAGKVTSVSGNTVTLKGPNGKSVKVTLDKNAFIVVRKATAK